jgi:hypothetical protein
MAVSVEPGRRVHLPTTARHLGALCSPPGGSAAQGSFRNTGPAESQHARPLELDPGLGRCGSSGAGLSLQHAFVGDRDYPGCMPLALAAGRVVPSLREGDSDYPARAWGRRRNESSGASAVELHLPRDVWPPARDSARDGRDLTRKDLEVGAAPKSRTDTCSADRPQIRRDHSRPRLLAPAARGQARCQREHQCPDHDPPCLHLSSYTARTPELVTLRGHSGTLAQSCVLSPRIRDI